MSKPRPKQPADNVGAEYTALTKLAFVTMLALVIARATMVEILRDPTPVLPGTTGPPRGAGVATSLVLDLLCCVPAILILLRRAIDRTYAIRFTLAHAFLLML